MKQHALREKGIKEVTDFKSEPAENYQPDNKEQNIQLLLEKIREKTKSTTEKPAVYHDNRAERLDQNEISNILTETAGTKSGLKEIIKQLLTKKIEDFKKSENEKLRLEEFFNKEDDYSFDITPVNRKRPVSFLDKLSAIYKPEEETRENTYSEENYFLEDNQEYESPYLSTEDSFFDADYERYFASYDALANLDYEDLTESDRNSQVKDLNNETININIDSLIEEVKKADIEKDFIAEEKETTETEAKELIDELEKLLLTLEDEANSESQIVEKTLQVIKSKLNNHSIQDLLKDSEFKDSVFYRFAVMKLPLREEDIPVAELAEIKKVVHNNIITATEETKNLLKELRKDVGGTASNDEEGRSKRIDAARKQLKKLLEIISPTL